MRKLGRRITGFSTPIGGVQWEPTREEQIVDKWVNGNYPNKLGITQQLKDEGFELSWTAATMEATRVDGSMCL